MGFGIAFLFFALFGSRAVKQNLLHVLPWPRVLVRLQVSSSFGFSVSLVLGMGLVVSQNDSFLRNCGLLPLSYPHFTISARLIQITKLSYFGVWGGKGASAKQVKRLWAYRTVSRRPCQTVAAPSVIRRKARVPPRPNPLLTSSSAMVTSTELYGLPSKENP